MLVYFSGGGSGSGSSEVEAARVVTGIRNWQITLVGDRRVSESWRKSSASKWASECARAGWLPGRRKYTALDARRDGVGGVREGMKDK